MLAKFKQKASDLKKETYVLYLVYKDSRISRWKRLFLGVVIGYAFCPIDLVPDFIPVLGYLDDLILIPLGIYIAFKLIPKEIVEESRKKASEEKIDELPIGKKTSLVIIFIWVVGLGIFFIWLINFLRMVLASSNI
ncbi:MAG: YkvA family protein [Candidatus Hodarchaeota archaeon]